jgi:hypothetical protein
MISFENIKKYNTGEFTNFFTHKEASEYEGCEYIYNNKLIIQRTAKITPTKIGQFVTLWKRNTNRITVPIEDIDNVDFVIIICIENDKVGHFLFPRKVLIDKKIMSSKEYKSKGKNGFRVYPIWDKPVSKQAITTQNWQVKYFNKSLELNNLS